jgi:prepilin-type N-terminal cleavage/methylation domain-containing protein
MNRLKRLNYNNPNTLKNSKGFTLLELIIAISLMAVLSITTTQILRSTTTKTKKITSGLEELNRLRSVLSIMRTDFLKAINHRDINIFLYNQAQKERVESYDKRLSAWIVKINKNESRTPPLTLATMTPQDKTKAEKDLGKKPEPVPDRKELIVTQFIGDKEKVYFTTASGFRFRKENKISELMEIGYYIKSCKSRRYPEQEFDCLWRAVSYNLDGEVTEDLEGSVLLENVEEFVLEYLGYSLTEGEVEWLENWDSRNAQDARFGEKFPQGVRLKLKAEFIKSKDGKRKRSRSITGFFPIAFPNNQPFDQIKFPETKTTTSKIPQPPDPRDPDGGTPPL